MSSKEHLLFLRKSKRNKIIIRSFQILIFFLFILFYELFGRNNIINSFITSYPSKIFSSLISLFINNNLLFHIFITLKEVILSFIITNIISIIVSLILFLFNTFDKIVEPYLTMINSLPKVALGPLIIISFGSSSSSIIAMAVLISVFTSIETISNCFKNTSTSIIKMLKSFNASTIQIIWYAIIPCNYKNIISSFKISISLCLIGTIMGEFLSSKSGVGYLILYGTQVFNMSLVMASIIVLLIMSLCLYLIIKYIEKHLI